MEGTVTIKVYNFTNPNTKFKKKENPLKKNGTSWMCQDLKRDVLPYTLCGRWSEYEG